VRVCFVKKYQSSSVAQLNQRIFEQSLYCIHSYCMFLVARKHSFWNVLYQARLTLSRE
jgi:hypothetical protein